MKLEIQKFGVNMKWFGLHILLTSTQNSYSSNRLNGALIKLKQKVDFLIMRNDGNLVVFDENGGIAWKYMPDKKCGMQSFSCFKINLSLLTPLAKILFQAVVQLIKLGFFFQIENPGCFNNHFLVIVEITLILEIAFASVNKNFMFF